MILKERYGDTQMEILKTVHVINDKLDALGKKINENLDAIHGHLLDFMATEGALFPTHFVLIPEERSFYLQEKIYKKYTLYFLCQNEGAMHIMMEKSNGYKLTEITKLGFGLMFLSKCVIQIALKQLSGISLDLGGIALPSDVAGNMVSKSVN